MATTITSTVHAVSDLTTDRLQIDLGDKIALLNPNENPATFVARKASSKKAKQPKVSWDTDVLRPDKDQINYVTAYASVDTALTVDNGDYFAVGDLWQVYDSYEIMYVAGTPASNIVEFTRNYPGTTSGQTGFPTTLADNDWLLRLGNASEEGSASPVAQMTQEVQFDNYCQITKTKFSLTETELASLFNNEAQLPYQTAKSAEEHKQEIERVFIDGIPSAAQTGSDSKLIRTAGGAWWHIKQNTPAAQVVSNSDVTEDEFLDFLRNAFRNGARHKWGFMCPIMASAMEKWGLIKLQTKATENLYGWNPINWKSPHGDLTLVIHKMLEGPNPGTVGGRMFVLDMNEIMWRPLRDTRLLVNIQAPDEDRYDAQYLTEYTFTFGNLSKHAAMYGINSFSA